LTGSRQQRPVHLQAPPGRCPSETRIPPPAQRQHRGTRYQGEKCLQWSHSDDLDRAATGW
jgi:hypothetical protein